MVEQREDSTEVLQLTADIVASHVSNNSVPVGDMQQLIKQVYDSLSGLGKEAVSAPPARPQPAVPIRKSVTPEYITCLEDGKRLKMLKRHLKTAYDMTAGSSTGNVGVWRRTIRWWRQTTPNSDASWPRRSALERRAADAVAPEAAPAGPAARAAWKRDGMARRLERLCTERGVKTNRQAPPDCTCACRRRRPSER